MSFSKRINISISPLRLHSASSVQIPSSTRKFSTMLPSIKIRPLKILSASSVNLHGITNSNVFHNNLRIRLSPLKSPILRKHTNPFKRCGMYPSISKCNAKKCKCCKGLSWFNWWVSFALEFQCCYFCEPSFLFYLNFNFDFYVSKIMHL